MTVIDHTMLEAGAAPSETERCVLISAVDRLSTNLEKGNVWYIRNFEVFGEVRVAYLIGHSPSVTQGRTTLDALGGTMSSKLDLILAPFHLFAYCRRIRPDLYIFTDQWFVWWTTALIRWFLGAKIVLMPVAMTDELYKNSGTTVMGLPYWVERCLAWLSYRCATLVVGLENMGEFTRWLRTNPNSRDKVLIARAFPGRQPDFAFQAQAAKLGLRETIHEPARLVYVGRLHPEKLADHLILVMAELAKTDPGRFRLILIGDGSQRPELERTAREHGVESAVEFRGTVQNEELVDHLAEADIFVSPLTGNSLREAGFCWLPVVAYDRNWIHGLLHHEHNVMLIPNGDVAGFAAAVRRLRDDPALRATIAAGLHDAALELWSLAGAKEGVEQAYRLAPSPGQRKRRAL